MEARQCVCNSCSNIINMLITAASLLKWRAASKSRRRAEIPKVLRWNRQTSCRVGVHKTVSVTLFTTHFYDEVMTIVLIWNPVTPIEEVLKNGSADNALPLVWAPSVTKRERVHCWCCIPAGTIPLFSRPQSGRLNWTTHPPHHHHHHHHSDALPTPPPLMYTPPIPPRLSNQPTNPPTTHSSHTRIPWSPVLIWVETFWALGGRGGGGGREGGEGVGLTQGRQEEKQWALAALS